LESNWRLNVEREGLSEWIAWPNGAFGFIYLHTTMIANLVTSFVFNGHRYSRIALCVQPDGSRFWNYLYLSVPWPWASDFLWTPAPLGFPFGAVVQPD